MLAAHVAEERLYDTITIWGVCATHQNREPTRNPIKYACYVMGRSDEDDTMRAVVFCWTIPEVWPETLSKMVEQW